MAKQKMRVVNGADELRKGLGLDSAAVAVEIPGKDGDGDGSHGQTELDIEDRVFPPDEERIHKIAEAHQDDDVKVIDLSRQLRKSVKQEEPKKVLWTRLVRLNFRLGPSSGKTMPDENDPSKRVVGLGYTQISGETREDRHVTYFNVICLLRDNDRLAQNISPLFASTYRKDAQKAICNLLHGRKVVATLKRGKKGEYLVLHDADDDAPEPTESLSIIICKLLDDSNPVWKKSWQTATGLDIVFAVTSAKFPLRFEMKDGKKIELR